MNNMIGNLNSTVSCPVQAHYIKNIYTKIQTQSYGERITIIELFKCSFIKIKYNTIVL